MTSSVRIVSAALAATLILAACGSDDSGDGATATSLVESTEATDAAPETTEAAPETTEAAPETTEAAPEQDVAADTAAAEAAVLTLAEFPEGWSEVPAEGLATELDGRLAECLELDGDRIGAAEANATAGDFVGPAGAPSVAQHIGVQATEQDARLVMARATVPDVLACFALAYADLSAELLDVGDGAQFGAATAERLDIGAFGDATQAIRVVVPVTADPAITAVTVDHVVIRSGRNLVTMTFENPVEPTSVETIGAVAGAAVARLAS